MDLTQVVPLLKIDKPLEILKNIIFYNYRIGNNKSMITVRATLAKTVVIEGAPVKIDKNNDVIFLIQAKSIAYVNVSELIMVDILNPEQVLDILTNGEFFEVPIDKVPGNLELKRTFNETQEQFKQTYGFMLNTFENVSQSSDRAKYQYHQFLIVLSKLLNEIAKDDLGRQALQKIDDFCIEPADKGFSLTKESQSLKLHIDFNTKFSADFEQQLRSMIEKNI